MKKFLVFLLSLTICLTPSLTFAGAEKWVVEKVVYESVAKVVDVTAKRATAVASNDPFYKARVPVTASATGSTVASMIRMGLAGVAIYGIVSAAGWIIKNGIVYKPGGGSNPIPPDQKYYYTLTLNSENSWQSTSASELYGKYVNAWNKSPNGWGKITGLRSSITDENFNVVYDPIYENFPNWVYKIVVQRVTNPDYDPDVDPSDSMLPVDQDELGEKVNSSPEAPQVLPDIYNPNNPAGGKAPQATSDALDNASPQTETNPNGETKPKPNVDTDGDGKPDVYDPDKPSVGEDFTLPEFCSWAVTVCEWYKKYKEDSKQAEAQRQSEQVAWQREEEARQKEEAQREKERTFWQKVEDWFDWTKEQPDKDDSNDIEVKKPDEFDTSIFSKDRFSVSRQCPVPEQHTLNVTGISVNFSFDMTPICDVLTLARPALVACSYLYAAYIVIGASRNG